MIIYSVTINIAQSIHDDWLAWMKNKHIPDVMATKVFEDYRMSRVITRDPEEEGTSYNIQYRCPSMADLHHYQAHFAPKLQKEHNERYDQNFVAFRTLLEEI